MGNKSSAKIPRCCCTCDRNKRVKDENSMVVRCECEIDGHYIGYVAAFEYSCKRYVLDKDYKLMENGSRKAVGAYES